MRAKLSIAALSLLFSEAPSAFAAVPRLVKDINTRPNNYGSTPMEFAALGDQFIFSASNRKYGVECWRSDGTAEGTALVKDINPGPPHSLDAFDSFARLGNALYFHAADPVNGRELWRT